MLACLPPEEEITTLPDAAAVSAADPETARRFTDVLDRLRRDGVRDFTRRSGSGFCRKRREEAEKKGKGGGAEHHKKVVPGRGGWNNSFA